MKTFGDLLASKRKQKRITLNKASKDLLIRREHLESLENETWQDLPDAAFVRGYITSYANYLGLDPDYILAIYRRDFDHRKYPREDKSLKRERRLFITPARLINLCFILAIVIFILYITTQYSSIFSAPKLEIFAPPSDETTYIPIVQITGKTEEGSTVAIDGKFAPVDEIGNFSYEYMLTDGKNSIEIISSKRLSPKSKKTLTIRLIR